MKVLFAVSNEEISESIVKKYQKEYKEIISYKNVYYFNAILKELQKDKTYDRIVISEDLEAFTHTQYDQIDKFIFEKLDSISDEASNTKGNDIPIILICSDRRTKSEQLLVKLFGIGVYDAIIGNDRSVDEVCKLIHRPRSKKEAKAYYKIDSEEVSYQAENENDVSEMEIQNIVAHYKRLGKNEDKYVDSFNNIAAQYNDVQLRIITKFLPLNVRAVLEEKSPKYQQIMSFNNSVSDNLRYNNKKEEKTGPSEKLLTQTTKEKIMTEPIVIPSSVNMQGNRKLSRKKPSVQIEENKEDIVQQEVREMPRQYEEQNKIEEISQQYLEQQPIDQFEDIMNIDENVEKEQPVVTPVKRGRGRPRKNPIQEENAMPTVKRGRGRPRKNPIQEPNISSEDMIKEELNMLPGFETQDDELNVLPGLESQEERYEENVLPGLEPETNEETYNILPGMDDDSILDNSLYSENNTTNLNSKEAIKPSIEENSTSYNQNNSYNNYNNYQSNSNYIINSNDEYQSTIDLSNLLTPEKKIVTFVGTSKNGTSFIVNNVAEYMSSVMGVNTAILDTTKNRNSYYIYTKNEEQLRKTAEQSIKGLAQGITQGINVNKNLTVYTALPDENDTIKYVDEILETLLKNYSLILIDTDFDTPIGYFKQSQETYLVQTLDVLTIQPLTAFLRELKAKNILDEKKLRIILNKTVKIRGITEKTIIGGMAYYNDPAMSFMTELFDRNSVKYVSIPFEEEIYTKYLQGIIECEITLKGYSKSFTQTLKELSNMIYPVISTKNNNSYTPPSVGKMKGNAFSSDMNSTLEQMRRNY